MLALTMGVVSANAQSVDSTAVTNTVAGAVTLTTDIYPQQEDGDIYYGRTKKLTFDRMIPPYGLEVTYDKTTHIIFPLRAYDYAITVVGNKDERIVFVFDKFIIPDDKVLVVAMHEKSGGRHQTFIVESEDIVRAKVINELKVKEP